jgi:mRNA interferase MazF
MPTFEQGDIVRVPFPYTDIDTRQRRPALVVSDGPVGDDATLLWVVMITSAANRAWIGDVPIPDHLAAGLPSPSVIRATKIATIEVRHAETIGEVTPATLNAAMERISAIIATTKT